MKSLIVVKEDSADGIKELITMFYKVTGVCLRPFFIQPYESLTAHPAIDLFDSPITFREYIGDSLANVIPAKLEDSELEVIYPWIQNSLYLNPYFYGRSFWDGIQYDDILMYIGLCMRYYLLVLEHERPSFVFDIESDNIIRTVLELACRRVGVRYMVVYNTRIDQRHLFGNGVIAPFNEELSYSRSNDNVDTYSTTSSLVNKLVAVDLDEKSIDANNSNISALHLLNSSLKNYIFHFHRIIKTPLLRDVRSRGLRKLLVGSRGAFLVFIARKAMRTYFNAMFTSKRTCKYIREIENRKYFFFPLGQIVEGAEPTFSDGYYNDMEALLRVYKTISPGVDLLVKDHRSMISDRPLFQRRLLNSSNLYYLFGRDLIRANSIVPPSDYIKHSQGILCLSGSSIFEAMLLGKPVYIFGCPWVRLCLRSHGYDPWGSLNSLGSFFKNPSDFIVPKQYVDYAVAHASKSGVSMSLFSIKRSNNLLSRDASLKALTRIMSSCLR